MLTMQGGASSAGDPSPKHAPLPLLIITLHHLLEGLLAAAVCVCICVFDLYSTYKVFENVLIMTFVYKVFDYYIV